MHRHHHLRKGVSRPIHRTLLSLGVVQIANFNQQLKRRFGNPMVPMVTIVTTRHLKKRILVQNRGGFEFQTDSVAVIATAGILAYVEDLKLGSNKEFGLKDLFEMACNKEGT